MVLNVKQFNREFGCSTCLHPGKRLTNGSRVYLPDARVQRRTNTAMLMDAKQAEESGCAINGVKGSSVLSPSIDLVQGIPVDHMHAVLEGVTCWLLKAWFESSNSGKPFYI